MTWLVATDLDGTLLNHHDYDIQPALPAIRKLQTLAVPIVFNTSKTLIEALQWQHELGLEGPMVLENGALVAVPLHQIDAKQAQQLGMDQVDCQQRTLWIRRFGPDYAAIVAILDQLRQAGLPIVGFHDLSVAKLVDLTGLSPTNAMLAKQRLATEPLAWNGDQRQQQQLSHALAAYDLQLTQGGRFLHVVPKSDKGLALQWLLEYVMLPAAGQSWQILALGDSANDLPMLERAHCAAVIRKHDDSWLALEHPHLLRSHYSGARGWAEIIDKWIGLAPTIMAR